MVNEIGNKSGLFCEECNKEFLVGDHVYTEYPENEPKKKYHPGCWEVKKQRILEEMKKNES